MIICIGPGPVKGQGDSPGGIGAGPAGLRGRGERVGRAAGWRDKWQNGELREPNKNNCLHLASYVFACLRLASFVLVPSVLVP